MVDPYAQPASSSAGMPIAIAVVMGLFYVAMLVFAVYCYVRVARKAGYSGWYAALCFVPLVNFVVLVMFCFKEWPIERELRMLRGGRGNLAPYPGHGRPGEPAKQGPAPAAHTAPQAQAAPPAAPWGQAPQQPAGWGQAPAAPPATPPAGAWGQPQAQYPPYPQQQL